MSLPLQSIFSTIYEAALEAANYIDTYNDYIQSAKDAFEAKNYTKVNTDQNIAESALRKVTEIESHIKPSDYPAYLKEVAKHVKK